MLKTLTISLIILKGVQNSHQGQNLKASLGFLGSENWNRLLAALLSFFLDVPGFISTAHILTSLLASAQVGGEITILVHMEPQLPKLGEDVTLFPGEMKNDTVSCVWYKGENETLTNSEILIYYIQNHTIYFKAAYDKRQFVGRDCVLHLRNLRSDDRAIYAIHKKRAGVMEKGQKVLEVSRGERTLSTMLPYRLLIWWCIWFNGY